MDTMGQISGVDSGFKLICRQCDQGSVNWTLQPIASYLGKKLTFIHLIVLLCDSACCKHE